MDCFPPIFLLLKSLIVAKVPGEPISMINRQTNNSNKLTGNRFSILIPTCIRVFLSQTNIASGVLILWQWPFLDTNRQQGQLLKVGGVVGG